MLEGLWNTFMYNTPEQITEKVKIEDIATIQDVEKLKTKPVQRLVLLQCSVGKIEKAGENIASAFARSVTGKVLAGDGVVNQNEVLHLVEKCIDYIN